MIRRSHLIIGVVCALVAVVGIALLVWISAGIEDELKRDLQRQFDTCVGAYVHGGANTQAAELQCAYIRDGF